MSMSTHVVGYQDADDEWRKMKAAWDACMAVDAPVPNSVSAFFGHESPGDRPGREIDIQKFVQEYSNGDYQSGFEIELAKLPKEVKRIRFYNSW